MRRPRPTLAQVDELKATVSGLRSQLRKAEADREAALAEARAFGARQVAQRRSLEQYVVALHDFNAGRQRLVGGPLNPDLFGGSTGFVPAMGATPTPNNPNPKLSWYQRRRRA